MICAAAHNDDADGCHICSTASTTTISHVVPRVNHDNTKQSIIQRPDENALNNDTIRSSSLRSVDRFPRCEAWTETRRRVLVHVPAGGRLLPPQMPHPQTKSVASSPFQRPNTSMGTTPAASLRPFKEVMLDPSRRGIDRFVR